MRNILLALVLLGSVARPLAAQCVLASDYQSVGAEHTLQLVLSQDELAITESTFCLDAAVIASHEICTDNSTSGTELWFELVPSTRGLVHTSVTSTTSETPVWRLFFDSGNLVPFTDCNTQNVSPEVLAVKYQTSQQKVYLQVMLPSERELTETDSLTVSGFLIPELASCYGASIHGDIGDAGKLQLVSREAGSVDIPILQPGEAVEVMVDIELINSFGGVEWFHGLFPMLGDGWDLAYFYEQNQTSIFSGTEGEWIDSNDQCAGFFNTGSNRFCTYVDDTGRLSLCSRLTENCDCQSSVEKDDPLPSGWFFTSNGNSALCENDCSPSSKWGGLQSRGPLQMSLKLRVETDPTKTDLSIGFLPTTDQYTGCWTDGSGNYCQGVMPIIFNDLYSSVVKTSFLALSVPEYICNEQAAEIEILSWGNGNNEVTLSFASNNNVVGLPTDTVVNSNFFTIPPLTNQVDAFQEITVVASTVDSSGMIVVSPPQVLILTSELRLLSDSILTCPAACQEFMAETNWGDSELLSFVWDNGIIGPITEICGTDEPVLTVANTINCNNLEVTIRNIPRTEFIPEILRENPFCIDAKIHQFELVIDPANPPDLVFWNFIIGFQEISVVSPGPIVEILLDIEDFGFDQMFVTASVFGSSACELEAVETIEIGFGAPFEKTDLVCDYVEDTEVLIRMPHDVQFAFAISATTFVSDLLIGEVVAVDADSLTLQIENPMLGEQQVEVLVDLFDLCPKILRYDLVFTGENFVGVDYEITDFEVDFSLVSLVGVQSVIWDFGDGSTSSELFPTKIYEQEKTYQLSVQVFTSCGVFTVVESIMIGSTSTDDPTKTWNIYPNPAVDFFIFEGLPSDAVITVFDIFGKEVDQQSADSQQVFRVEVSDWPAGMYLTTIRTASGEFHLEKLMVTR